MNGAISESQNKLGSPFLLAALGLVKDYPGVRALEGVNLQLQAGEALGLCGENGAGKSTLLKILSGHIPKGDFEGQLYFAGQPLNLGGPRDALRLGIRIIHQELALAPDLTVAENLFLGQEIASPSGFGLWGKLGGVNTQAQMAKTRWQLDLLGLTTVTPTQKVGQLSIGLQQGVEIARALLGGGKVLILDEPTSALSQKETEALLELVLKLKRQGIGIIYVSHKLGEVFRIADRLVILRNGRSVGTVFKPPFTGRDVATAMVGRNLQDVFPEPKPVPADNGIALQVENLNVRQLSTGRSVLQDFNLTLKIGEIVGLAGLLGSGRTETVEALFGIPRWQATGHIQTAKGKKTALPLKPKQAMRLGLSLLPEDRRRHGLLTAMPLRFNHSLATLNRYCRLGGWLRQGQERADAFASIKRLRIKATHTEVISATLSGGNQQKVVLAKWLLAEPQILLLDDPTRGVDVGAKAEIYRLIVDLAAQGMSIVITSSENDEVIKLAHRVLVLREGHLIGEYARGTLDNDTLVTLCTAPWSPPLSNTLSPSFDLNRSA
jgi:D-xylose transport system ATP-binding protein